MDSLAMGSGEMYEMPFDVGDATAQNLQSIKLHLKLEVEQSYGMVFTVDAGASSADLRISELIQLIDENLGANMVVNPSFEDWTSDVPDGWTWNGSSANLSQSSDAQDGDSSANVVLVATYRHLRQYNLTLDKNKVYYGSAWVKGKGYVRIGMKYPSSSYVYYGDAFRSRKLDNDWTRISVLYSPKYSGTNGGVSILLAKICPNAEVQVDNVYFGEVQGATKDILSGIEDFNRTGDTWSLTWNEVLKTERSASYYESYLTSEQVEQILANPTLTLTNASDREIVVKKCEVLVTYANIKRSEATLTPLMDEESTCGESDQGHGQEHNGNQGNNQIQDDQQGQDNQGDQENQNQDNQAQGD